MKLDRFSPQTISLWLALAYTAHLLDERFTGNGVADWATRVAGMPFSNDEWLVVNAISLAIIWGVAWAIRAGRLGSFAMLILAGHILMHGTQHLAGAVRFGAFSPGIATGFLVCLPVGLIAATAGFRRLPRWRAAAGLACGLVTFQPIWHALLLSVTSSPGHAA